jgi:hypothetical protein
LPFIAIDVRSSVRVRLVAIAFAAALLMAFLLAPQPSWTWRALACALAALLGWRPVRTVIFGQGPRAVCHAEYRKDGSWEIADNAGRRHSAQLHAASVTLGPWLLLIWKTSGQGRFQALIDASCSDTAAFRALKGRLNC